MKRKISFSLVVVMMLSFVINALPVQVANAAVNYVTATRTTSESTLYLQEDKESEVNLTIQGTPPVNVVKPNDIMLLLDKSGSMNSNKNTGSTKTQFQSMKESAIEFTNLIDFSKHNVGVVDYSSITNTYSEPLTNDKSTVQSYINNIVNPGTDTQTGLAIEKAIEEFQANGRSEAQPVIILLTDGEASNTPHALEAAQKAKDAGIVFYTIALLKTNVNPDTSAYNALLKDMATTAHHHHFVLGSVGLIDIYRSIVKEIGVASAYDVKITEQVAPQFEVVEGSYDSNIPKPTYDKDTNTLTWSMLELKDQALDLGYKVKLKDGVTAGTYNVASSSKIAYKDYAGKSCSYTVPNKSIEVKNLPLTVESITEPKADVAGGENVTIKGTNFRDGVTVKFNSTLATNVTVVDENTITATVPAGKQGKATVTVTNDDKSSGTLDFYYEGQPEVTSLTPDNGPFEGDTLVKIYGSNFMNDIKVYFGTEEASVKYYNNGYLIATTPKATANGAVDVTLENGDGTKTVVSDGFTYDEEIKNTLEVTSLDVTSGVIDGGNDVIIEGKNFVNAPTVKFGDKEAKMRTFYSSSKIKVAVPANTEGVVDVTVTNPDGESATLKDAYEYVPAPKAPAPEITSLSQTSGYVTGGDLVYIDGKNFVEMPTATVGGKEAVVRTFNSANKIRIEIPEGVEGVVDVTVTNPDGQSAELKDAYEYVPAPKAPAPEITSLSQTSGYVTGGDYVYVDGKNFVKMPTATVGGKEAVVRTFNSANKIRIEIPEGVEGVVDVTVTNPDGQSATLKDAYEYVPAPKAPAPEVTSLSQTSGLIEGGDLVYIEGNNFVKAPTVTIGGKEATFKTYSSAKKIRVQVPEGVVGPADVVVTNPDGQSGTLVDGYTYVKAIPTIKTVKAASGKFEGGETVYITGTNLSADIKVYFGTEEATISRVDSSVQIRVVVPKAVKAGAVTVKVENADGDSSELVDGYTYEDEILPEAPVISYFTTNGAVSGKITGAKVTQRVYLVGTGFKSNVTVMNVYDSTGKCVVKDLAVTYNSATRVRFLLPSDLPSGDYKITMYNPDDDLESDKVDYTVQ